MAKSRQAVPNATIPEDRQNHDCRRAVPFRTYLLRWSVSKLSSAASVSESAIDDFELERTVEILRVRERALQRRQKAQQRQRQRRTIQRYLIDPVVWEWDNPYLDPGDWVPLE